MKFERLCVFIGMLVMLNLAPISAAAKQNVIYWYAISPDIDQSTPPRPTSTPYILQQDLRGLEANVSCVAGVATLSSALMNLVAANGKSFQVYVADASPNLFAFLSEVTPSQRQLPANDAFYVEQKTAAKLGISGAKGISPKVTQRITVLKLQNGLPAPDYVDQNVPIAGAVPSNLIWFKELNRVSLVRLANPIPMGSGAHDARTRTDAVPPVLLLKLKSQELSCRNYLDQAVRRLNVRADYFKFKVQQLSLTSF